MKKQDRKTRNRKYGIAPTAAAITSLLGSMGSAQAFNIQSGNPNIFMLWGLTQ